MKSLYSLLLNLFPRTYRNEYRDEMQSVFELALKDAMKAGKLEVVRVSLLELLSLPKAIVLAHLQERRNSQMLIRTLILAMAQGRNS